MIEIHDQADIQNQLIDKAIQENSQKVLDLIQRKVYLENISDPGPSVLKELKSISNKLKKLSKPITQDVDIIKLDKTSIPDTQTCIISSKYKIPTETWEKLLNHQKIGVEWLYSIHEKGTGGLLGDEMGLGKTVMISVFLEGLRSSNLLSGPIIVICPATLIDQWKSEINNWSPQLQVYDFKNNRKSTVKLLFKEPYGVLLITYEILHTEHQLLYKHKWFYVVLDEGHKLRNPHSAITKLCKGFKSFHRVILSGTPIQNSLIELWSLFDFVCPGLLGDIEVFNREFSTPITKAGYSKSNDLEVELGYQCAVQLRELISPYILRRTKKDVNIGIPLHQEKILYCELDISQWEAYNKYLEVFVTQYTKDHENFAWIKDLRYICNHPCMLKDDVLIKLGLNKAELTSGKLNILIEILDIWKHEGHSILIFSQYKKMLSLAEQVLINKQFLYGRIDGDMEISKRLPAISEFNSGTTQVLLLTTKVGGLGINLPKASRVVLLDPDWNPMNDSQAKERALRIGQKENLIIYRFITRHTIEEKIYNRQIFKLFLANKVRLIQILHNPDQKKFFQTKEMQRLFEKPPKPVEIEEIFTETLPQKRSRENKMIEMVLSYDLKDYQDLNAVQNSDSSRLAEIYRTKQHAQE
jgi:DNA excision repair protein ERCC-6